MERTSKHPRLLAAKALVALLVAAFAATVPASVGAVPYANDILLRVVNNSDTPVSMSYCPGGHVSMAYKVGTRTDPCDRVTETSTLEGNGGVRQSKAGVNPFGVIMRVKGRTVYMYASNPPIGKPFFEIDGEKVPMVAGQLTTKHAKGTTVRFHREGDRDSKKIMTIEITGIPKV